MLVSQEQLEEWLRLDPDADASTVGMLVESAADIIEHMTGRRLRPYTDLVTSETIEPEVPASLKHAIAVFVAAGFDDREGASTSAMTTVARLCAPYRVMGL